MPEPETGQDRLARLRGLGIDRTGREPAKIASARGGVVLAGILAAAGAILAAILWRPAPTPIVQDPAGSPPAQGPAVSPAVTPSWVVAGYLVARRQSVVGAEVAAKIADILVQEGERVERGRLIAELDDRLAEADLAVARARARAAGRAAEALAAESIEAERALARTRSLAGRSIASEAELGRVEARAAILRAKVDEARARHDAASREADRAAVLVGKHRIEAPFAGIVTGCTAQPGEIISPNSAGGGFTRTGVCTLVDTGSIEIEADIAEMQIGRIRLGAPASAILDAYPDAALPVTVRAIVPSANREKSTIKVRLTFDAPDERLLPDMGVKVSLSPAGTPKEMPKETP